MRPARQHAINHSGPREAPQTPLEALTGEELAQRTEEAQRALQRLLDERNRRNREQGSTVYMRRDGRHLLHPLDTE